MMFIVQNEKEDSLQTIGRIIDQIEACLKDNLIFPALFMSLSLPDVCGKAKWPKLSKTSERYEKWFDQYVDPLLNPPYVVTNRKEEVCFDSVACYQLRCALLHAGETDIGENISISNFYIDLDTSVLKASTLFSGTIPVVENGVPKTITYLNIQAMLVVDAILTGVKSFRNELLEQRKNGRH